MSEKSSEGMRLRGEAQDVTDTASNKAILPTDDQKEIPKQNERFIIAMIPAKKKPLSVTTTEKSSRQS